MERTKNSTDVKVVSNHGDALSVRVRPGKDGQVVDRPEASPYFHSSARFSRVAAAILLVPGCVVMALLVVLVRLTSRGPGVYRQLRVGKSGRTFTLYKIRTMRQDAEANSGAVWAQRSDPRTTRLGAVMRRMHLDEFPQLINVLRGEMVLVGPRPERPEFTKTLAKQIPGYLDRLRVPPGITGLAQINLQPDVSLDCVRRKLSLDLQYIEEANWWLDARILACTFLRLLNIRGKAISKLFGIHRQPKALPGDDARQSSASKWNPSQNGSTSAVSQHGDVRPKNNGSTARERLGERHSPPV